MFFIFGSPRSGTTLLSSSLDLHDEVVVPDETDFIVPLAFIFDRIKDAAIGRDLIASLIISTERYPHSLAEFLSKDEVRKTVLGAEYSAAKIVSAIYDRIAKKKGKKIPGDKSPNDLLFLRMLVKTGMLEPQETKIIHVIRDVRAVTLSLQKTDWGRAMTPFFPRFWNYSNLYLHEVYRERAGKYLLVKYEELVSHPESVFRRITDLLGVEFQDKILDPTNRGVRKRADIHHQLIAEPYQAQRAGGWRSEISAELLELCARQADEAIGAFGYR